MSPGSSSAGSHRLQSARDRVAAARSAADTARAAAVPARTAQAARRRTRVLVITTAAAVVAALLVVGVIALAIMHSGADGDRDRDADVLDDTRSAVTTLLTIDPAEPDAFVDSALAVTSGEQHERLERSRNQLIDVIGSLRVPSTGQVLSAGIVGDESDDTAEVFVVAEGTNPTVLGADPTQNRVALLVTMKDTDGTWTIDRTQLQ